MKDQTTFADRSQYPAAGNVDAARAADLDRGSKQRRKAKPVRELGRGLGTNAQVELPAPRRGMLSSV